MARILHELYWLLKHQQKEFASLLGNDHKVGKNVSGSLED